MSRVIDETSNHYGRLTVLKQEGFNKQGSARWRCSCICGKEIIVNGSALRSGNTRSCGCLASEIHSVDETGNRYGMLTVIERSGINRSGSVLWLCRCDCGKEIIIRSSYLRTGVTKHCGCQKRKLLPPDILAMRQILSNYKGSARRRGYVWGIPEKDFAKLILQKCYYCGSPPSNFHGSPSFNGRYAYNGLDRIDNSLGYTLENVVSCCAACNTAKGDKSLSEFIKNRRGIMIKIEGYTTRELADLWGVNLQRINAIAKQYEWRIETQIGNAKVYNKQDVEKYMKIREGTKRTKN